LLRWIEFRARDRAGWRRDGAGGAAPGGQSGARAGNRRRGLVHERAVDHRIPQWEDLSCTERGRQSGAGPSP